MSRLNKRIEDRRIVNKVRLDESTSISVTAGTFDDYLLNDYDVNGTTTYIGKCKPNGDSWLIQKMVDTSGDLTITWANISNNGGTTTYATAWTNRASLTYNRIGTLTF